MLRVMTSKTSSSSRPARSAATHSATDPKSATDRPQPIDSGLYIVATPIGNLRDITLRALDVLASVDEVLAEDTRVARKLFDAYSLKTSLTPYHDHNGARRRPEILDKLADGGAIALISDAGTPLVSDPGWKLVSDAAQAGHKIIPLPGPSAMLAALVTSALPSDRFQFCGFLSAKSGARQKQITALKPIDATLIFYESGPRLVQCLSDLAEGLGKDRDAAVARELTKLFEETRRGTLSSLAEHYAEIGAPKGEIVVLVGPPKTISASAEDLDQALRAVLGSGPLKTIAADVAEALKLPKRDVYQRALALKSETE